MNGEGFLPKGNFYLFGGIFPFFGKPILGKFSLYLGTFLIYDILKAYKSHLKFRLPYVDTGSTLQRRYLNGDIYFLIWGRSHTSEVS